VSDTHDPTSEAILDATRASVLDFGIRRTTLSDVARRAGVSRKTVYRRYPDVDAVLRDLMTREFGALMDEVAAGVAGANGRARIVEGLTAAVGGMREHPLMRKVLDAEPELLLPYVLGRMGATQLNARRRIDADVAAGQADGSVRAGDPKAIAQATLLVMQSFLFSAGIAEDVSEEAMLAELSRVVDAMLAP
jgi:AcrR family transcriptional regulator